MSLPFTARFCAGRSTVTTETRRLICIVPIFLVCDDISEFESYMPSHAVGSLWRVYPVHGLCEPLLGQIASPFAANAALATASAIFSFGVRVEVVPLNPCSGVERNPPRSRERVLSDAEVVLLWNDLDVVYRIILLCGARPGEVHAMRREDVRDGVWSLPGEAIGSSWPGTKSGVGRRLALSEPALALVDEHLARPLLRRACEERLKKLWRRRGIENLTPHDMRRTHGTWITRLGFGRQAMDRVLGHADRSVGSVYDRYSYERCTKRVRARGSTRVVPKSRRRLARKQSATPSAVRPQKRDGCSVIAGRPIYVRFH
jgi:integrase